MALLVVAAFAIGALAGAYRVMGGPDRDSSSGPLDPAHPGDEPEPRQD